MTPPAPDGAPDPSDGLWPARDLVWLLLSTLGLMFVAGALADWTGGEDVSGVNHLLAWSSLATLAPAAVLIHARPRRRDAIGLVASTGDDIVKAVLWGLALMPTLAVLNLVVHLVFGADEHPQAGLMFDQMSAAQLAVAAAFSVVVVPFAEELVFRGIVLSALLERGPADPVARRRLAIGVSSLIFGLFHVDPLIIPATTALGAAAAMLRLRTGSLWPAVVLHGFNNAVATAVLAAGAF